MDRLTAVGIGLDKDTIRLERTTSTWVDAGAVLRQEIERFLGPLAVAVAQIGSSSVSGLLAKPIVDLAVGLPAEHDVDSIVRELERPGWIYRGDAGDAGGYVFVLEARPGHRVAHIHGVEYEGRQWLDYMRLRRLLLKSPEARQRYERVKLRLAQAHPHDRVAYTDGKDEVVTRLLAAD